MYYNFLHEKRNSQYKFNLKRLLIVLVLLLCTVSVNASNQTLDNSVTFYLNFSNNLVDAVGGLTGTGYGGIGFTNGISGGKALNCQGTDDYVDFSANQVFNLSNSDYTVCVLFSATTYSDKGLFNRWGGENYDEWDLRISGAGATQPAMLISTTGVSETNVYRYNANYASGSGVVFCSIKRGGRNYLYLNKTQYDSGADTTTVQYYSTKSTSICKFTGFANTYFVGLVDEIYFSKIGLNSSDQNILVDNWFANKTYPFSNTVTLPSMNIFNNMVNDSKNINEPYNDIYYNLTNSTGNTIGFSLCTLYDNNVLSVTAANNLFNTDYMIRLNWSASESGLHVLKLNCSNSEVAATTAEFYYYIDRVEPLIGTSFVDRTNYTQYSTSSIKFNVSDDNLFGYQFLVLNSLGEAEKNVSLMDINTTFAEYTFSRIETVLGNFTVNITAWDSHNPVHHAVKPLEWYFSDNNILAEGVTFNGDFVKLDSKGRQATYFYLDENKYKFKVTFAESSVYHSITVSAPGLYLRRNDGYKGHFVYWPGKRFIDFEGANVEAVQVIKLSEDTYQVDVTLHEASDEIEFESIGDLNVNSITRRYSVKALSTSGITEEQYSGIIDSVNRIYEVLRMLAVIILFISLLLGGAFVKDVWTSRILWSMSLFAAGYLAVVYDVLDYGWILSAMFGVYALGVSFLMYTKRE